MSERLANNIYKMRNDEVIGLAKNRWLPKSVQMAIAKHPYTRAHWYLAENDGLDEEVRDYLWSDECNRGYSIKTMMISHGQYRNSPEKYRELYERYPSMWTRSSWRASSAFFGHYWYRNKMGSAATPPDLLNRIYDEKYDPKLAKETSHGHYHPRYELERLAKHNNVDLKLAIKLSQCGIDSVQSLGFAKIVELS